MNVESSADPLIDVSDLFDAFHALATHVLLNFELRDAAVEHADVEPGFDVLIDQLELDAFLPACARRLYRLRGMRVDPDDVPRLLRLYDHELEPLHGAAGTYHSHAFLLYAPNDDRVPNEVLGGDLLPRSRSDVRILLDTRLIDRPRSARPMLRLLKVMDEESS